MAPVDQDRILQYEAEIREAEGVLAEIVSGDIEDFVRNSLKIRAMKYTLIVLVEAMCNICRHILANLAAKVTQGQFGVETILDDRIPDGRRSRRKTRPTKFERILVMRKQ